MTKREDNMEFIARLMNHNPQGALAQAFIIEAVAKYAKAIAEAPPVKDTIISGAAWKACGEHIDREMTKRFASY